MSLFFVNVFEGLIQAVVAFGLAYHYLLLFAGGPRKTRRAVRSEQSLQRRFAILVPAHNEAQVIGATVSHLRRIDYPGDRFGVHVVADYCDDMTAAEASAAGGIVHERHEGPRGRKGYALDWGLKRLLRDPLEYDAIVVFDADSRVSPDFLARMDMALSAGHRVVQGCHVIANPGSGSFSSMADVDMRLNNRIRNQAKANLGLSARLMGDAMCFRRDILETYPWSEATSLVEDREYGIYLTAQGVRIAYQPAALSRGQAASRWRDATSQRLRWYGGVFELQRRYIPVLFRAAFTRRNWAALDLALELLLPPFSVLALLAAGSAALGVLLRAPQAGRWDSLVAGSALTLLVLAYPFVGLLAERAPARSFTSLLLGPAYAVWRVWIALRVGLHRGNVPWVRTRRAEELRG